MAKSLELGDCRTRDQFTKVFVRRVHEIARHNRPVDVFRDFLALSTFSISNSMMFNKDHESAYMKIVAKYEKKTVPGFCDLLAITVEALEILRDDFLGHVYMSEEMSISEAGQFFTPSCLADVMAMMTLGGMQEFVDRNGYVTINDPACGGGVQLIAAYKAAVNLGVNPSTQICVYAEDIDTTCVYMTYVQLSLLGIPALVSHRNTISMETWDQWRTPVWWLNGFEYREAARRNSFTTATPKVATSTNSHPTGVDTEYNVDFSRAVQNDLFAM